MELISINPSPLILQFVSIKVHVKVIIVKNKNWKEKKKEQKLSLKEYSILRTSIMTWIRRYWKKKKNISKISVDSNFKFTIYAWLCCPSLFLRLIECWIKSRQWEFMSKLLSFHNEMFQLKGCGMGPWLVLVSPCFRENEVATCKIGSFLCSLDNLLQKNI